MATLKPCPKTMDTHISVFLYSRGSYRILQNKVQMQRCKNFNFCKKRNKMSLSFSFHSHRIWKPQNERELNTLSPTLHFGEKSLCMSHRVFPAKNKREVSAKLHMP